MPRRAGRCGKIRRDYHPLTVSHSIVAIVPLDNASLESDARESPEPFHTEQHTFFGTFEIDRAEGIPSCGIDAAPKTRGIGCATLVDWGTIPACGKSCRPAVWQSGDDAKAGFELS